MVLRVLFSVKSGHIDSASSLVSTGDYALTRHLEYVSDQQLWDGNRHGLSRQLPDRTEPTWTCKRVAVSAANPREEAETLRLVTVRPAHVGAFECDSDHP
ncbi:hypothetical protein [Natrinema halophilum]|uniref:hypothetical protein n=1 Tax=Natrinema halophilum TaxID=1699371 RepID=UPI001F36E858|nr:hypothetical protein [Natrinema halophilum]UHQ96328.1 hypothetical protein HYG82_21965 [Natrinema halophilum]